MWDLRILGFALLAPLAVQAAECDLFLMASSDDSDMGDVVVIKDTPSEEKPGSEGPRPEDVPQTTLQIVPATPEKKPEERRPPSGSEIPNPQPIKWPAGVPFWNPLGVPEKPAAPKKKSDLN